MARYMMMRPRGENGGDMRGENGGMSNNYSRYGVGMQNGGPHETESRSRDNRGREHYENGRYAPTNAYAPEYRGEMGVENRNGQRRTRDGRFRAESGREMRSAMDDDDEGYHMNTIGFGNRDYPEFVYQQGGARVENGGPREMDQHSGSKEHGGVYSEDMELTPELAKEWTSKMQNGDGTTGAHWPMEQVKQLAKQRGLNVEPVELFAVLNAIYSDYYKVAKKHNVHNMDFYLDMAVAWLEDKDAVPNKAAVYYECVVQH